MTMKKATILLSICLAVLCIAGCAKKTLQSGTEPETGTKAAETTVKETEAPKETAESPAEETKTSEESTPEPETVPVLYTEPAMETEASFEALPDGKILLSFADEVPYDPAGYPEIPKTGSAEKEEVDQLLEGVSDMLLAAEEDGTVPDFIYGDCTTQVLYPDEEKGARIIDTYIATGNRLMDEVMKKEGYTDYSMDYYYLRTAWIPAGEEMNVPVCVDMNIGGKKYRYCFLENELVYREGPDGESLNPETNRFMQSIYQLGCYYGNVVDKERNRYSLFITGMDQITGKDGTYVITCGLQGREGTWSFVIDPDTVFSEDCEREYFSGLHEGESAYEWYSRAYEELSKEEIPEDTEFDLTALVGIFDLKTTGNHVDELCGCYWWD